MKLRSFNSTGISCFREFRASQTKEAGDLETLIQDSSLSTEINPSIDVRQQEFSNRFSAGEYLFRLFSEVDIPNLDDRPEVWTWLAAFYFRQLCPVGTMPGRDYRWEPSVSNFRNYYRHLLAGPYYIYRAHQNNPQLALAVLATPLHRPGDIVEQLASRQEIVTNKTVMDAATQLYIGVDGTPKPGAAGRGGGSARRLADVLTQLDLTWDLYDISTEKLIELLPAEFDGFKS